MKKSKILLLCALSVVVLYSCEEQKKEKPKMEEQEEQEEQTDAKEPEGIISLKEAKVLCTNYEDRRLKTILDFEMRQGESSETFIPTQFIDFDLNTIKKYIKYVEKEARRAHVKPDSLRIYLGNYGPEGREANKNTVFLLPTASINGNHGGFYIDDNGDAKLIRNYWPESKEQGGDSKAKASILPNFNPFQNGKSFILNYGQGGPPPTGDF